MRAKANESGLGSHNSFPVGLVNEPKVTPLVDKGSKVVFVEPTAEELSRVTFAKLRDFRIHAQELRNRFARLLNRGSSLE
jgi:hypothetical protein